jgi:hypothetical protein
VSTPSPETARPARIRRAPRFGRFLAAGVLLGVVAAGVLTAVFAPPAGAGRGTVFLYLALTLVLFTAVTAVALAALADRRKR